VACRLHREPEPRFGLRQDREGDAVAIVLQPRLADQQAAGAIVAPSIELGLGALNDEGGVEPWLARRGGEQGFRRVPRPAREPEGFSALGRDVRRGLLGRGGGQR